MCPAADLTERRLQQHHPDPEQPVRQLPNLSSPEGSGRASPARLTNGPAAEPSPEHTLVARTIQPQHTAKLAMASHSDLAPSWPILVVWRCHIQAIQRGGSAHDDRTGSDFILGCAGCRAPVSGELIRPHCPGAVSEGAGRVPRECSVRPLEWSCVAPLSSDDISECLRRTKS